ncbi:MAG: PadR family transcriptional regulator [Bryobacteraceae bacterium]|nr:PadR family transcriptional regulator [Bryobacteraceae bacterium]
MPKGESLGEFEHIVMLAVLRLDAVAYGMRIRHEIERRTARDVTIGAVYSTLERLELKALISSSAGEPTPERGGRAKRFFRVTPEGVQALNRVRRELDRMFEGMPAPLPEGGQGK